MNDKDNIGTIEAPKDVASACDISINNIFAQLHEKAYSEAESAHPDYNIQNSAIENKDGSFYGPGTHIILAVPAKEGGECTKDGALETIKTYVQRFVGPDIAGRLKVDDLWPFEEKNDDSKEKSSSKSKKKAKAEEYTDKEDEDKAEEGKEGQKEVPKESLMCIPSFKMFLLTEKDSKDGQKSASADENAEGYYIKYKLQIKGQPEKTLSASLKNLGSEFIQSIGLAIGGDWRSGTSGKMHTVGRLVNALKDVFGKLDPDKVKSAYDTQLREKMPQTDAQTEIFDTSTIALKCKKWLSSSDKSKLKNAELAICTKVTKTDASYKLFNPQAIADMLTKSISGLFKQFKNKVSPKDVILVNNYSDDTRHKKEKYERTSGETGTVADSIAPSCQYILSEAKVQKLSTADATSQLQQIVSSDLGAYSPESLVTTTEKAVDKLEEAGVNEPELFKSLKSKSKYAYMIWLKSPVKESHLEHIDAVGMLLEKIFDPKDDIVVKDVKKVFQKFILDHEDLLPDGENPKMDAVDALEGHVKESPKKNDRSDAEEGSDGEDGDVKESQYRDDIKMTFSKLFSSIYGAEPDDNMFRKAVESIKSDDSMLFEKSNSQKSRDHITNDQAAELIRYLEQQTLPAIQKNIDQVKKKWEEPKSGQESFSFKNYEPIHSDVEKMLMSTDDNALDELKSYINLAIHDKSDTAKKKKIVLTRLIPAVKDLPKNSETEELDKEKEEKNGEQTVWFIVPDENNLIESKTKSIEHTDDDFYIVPMPGLSYDAKKRYDASTQTIKDQ